MSERYFDDFVVGERFQSESGTITEAEIIAFAEVYDPQPFHIDPAAADEGPFGGLIASGFQTLGMTFRLFYETGAIRHCSMGSPGFDHLRWVRPVRPGDSLTAHAEVKEMRVSKSKPDRGLLVMAFETRNQDGDVVMSFQGTHILQRRPGQGAD